MSTDVILTLLIFVGTMVGLVCFQAKPAKVFGITMLSLLLTGLADKTLLLASIANSGLLTLILLIVCSIALEKTHILRLVSTKLMVNNYTSTWIRLFSSTVLSSAILNNTAVVATLLSPVRNNPYHASGKLLIPLSYAAILGGTLTLIGTSTNLIVNSLYLDAAGHSLNFFSFTGVGICLVFFCGLAIWFSHRFLPESRHEADEFKGYFIDARLRSDSLMIGKSVEENGLRHLESLFLTELVRSGRLISPVSPSEVLEAGDRLIFSGDVTKVMQIKQFSGLELFADSNGLLRSNLTEVVIRQESMLTGNTLKEIGFRAMFDAAVVAVRRDGEQLSGKLGELKLKVGDFLVLAVGDDFRSRKNVSKNFIVLSGVEPESKMSAVKSWLTVLGFVGVVALAALGVVDLLLALVVLTGVLLLTKALTVNEVTRRLPFDIWIVVSSALLFSQVLLKTGTSELLLSVASLDVGKNPLLVLATLYFLTWIITELVTNNAAAALMFPIGWSMATAAGVDPMPFIMTIAFAASASFLSPYGYQTNLMVFNAGGYKLHDFLKVGAPVSLVYAAVVIITVPYFFSF
ncbi:SLC13 family permease [Photobacterium sp. TLY01]|uniref:SLC13 family permease n=1 Tax=Photobacterium sp. TLY01 TaxID=2907534 RepID=UPI001F43EBE3|nr:SLC13 family permease [Photobacterium sp. TLY01]UIP27206.1 SLC13 family permease [Photobacterium sp. TLY01]